jgi:hypothetical protein
MRPWSDRERMALVSALLVAAAAVPADPLAAQERITAYDSEVDVRADGTLDVVERITVIAEGRQIRRGIYRDFPTSYRDRYGNRVRVGLEVLGVERDGRPEPWFTERVSNGVRINTGDDSFLRVPAEYRFTIRYRTTRQLGFFDRHDELYWNVIGTGWVFPIERGSVMVRLPEPVPVQAMAAEGYTGRQGVRGYDYAADVPSAGVARYTLTAPLAPREGFTLVLTFPKGIVAEPTAADRARWLLADNRGILVALAGLIAMLVFCFVRWSSVGRDPAGGVIIPRYFPPEGRTPAATRYLRRMGYDSRCFTSDLLDLAVAGHLTIHREEGRRRDEWRLERVEAAPRARSLGAMQQRLLERLFRFRSGVTEVSQSNASLLSAAQSAHSKMLDEDMKGRYFTFNGGSVATAALIGGSTIGLGGLVSGGHGVPVIVGVAAIAVVALLVFAWAVRAYTPEGRKLMDEVEGLRLYLGVAERQELAGMAGPAAPPGAPPPLDTARYEAMLPYAVALDVEDAWTRKFTAAVGAAAAAEVTRGMAWYSGSRPVTDLGSLTRSLGSGLSSQIASASSPPGSSSGSGGGGSSGGGGGGGGGGGR